MTTPPIDAAFKRELVRTVRTKVDLSEAHKQFTVDAAFTDKLRSRLRDMIAFRSGKVNDPADEPLIAAAIADLVGFGPLESLLADPSVLEIMVNGPDAVYVERRGNLEPAGVAFDDEEHIGQLIERLIAPLGYTLTPTQPLLDLRLPDMSRVLIVMRPVSASGSTIVIRKMITNRLTMPDLVNVGAINQMIADFLTLAVRSRANICVAGSVGAGKTTVLNVLTDAIPAEERLITVEDGLFLAISNPHVVRLEARPADADGRGQITLRQLTETAMKMRPDRIIVGEVQGAEAYPMLQALNLGIDGGMFSLHANSVTDVLLRLEIMMTEAIPSLPVLTIREQIAAALDLITYQERLPDGTRRLMRVAAVTGVESGVVMTQDLFTFVQPDPASSNGFHTATGQLPERLRRKLKGDLPVGMLTATPNS
jgi:pilus assembly protein CpaF